MNQNFKIKLVAILATLSGSAWGTCHGMQVDGTSTEPVESGVVRLAEPTYDGSFGAVKVAHPQDEYRSNAELPPIVSAVEANHHSPQQQPAVLPPIVSPFNSNEPPIVVVQSQAHTANDQDAVIQVVESQTAPQETEGKNSFHASGMLSPLVPIVAAKNNPTDVSATDAPMPFAPAPVIQAGPEVDAQADLGPIVQANPTPVDTDDYTDNQQAAQWETQSHLSKGVSSAGIPLYPESAQPGMTGQHQSLPLIIQGKGDLAPANMPSIIQASDSDAAPVIRSSSQIVSPMNTLPASAPMPIGSNPTPRRPSMVPMRTPQVPMDSVVVGGGVSNQDPTYFSTPPMEAPVINSGTVCNNCGGGGCSQCGTAGAVAGDVSGCQSCGPGGCFNDAEIASQFAASGSVASARHYMTFDLLYFSRYDGTIAVSNYGGLNNFEDDLYAARFTFGSRQDAANGREFVYLGSAKMGQSATHTDPLGRIFAGYANGPIDPFTSETSSFRRAVEQSQAKSTTIQSFECNRVDWGWDVVKTFIGFRYVYVKDEYTLSSRNILGQTGLFELETQNNLFGPQVGYELFYDVGYRFSMTTNGKFGLFANPNRVSTRLNNAGSQFLDLDDDQTAFSGLIELGLHGQYKISRRSRLRFGYTALWLDGVSGTSDNIPLTINPTTGSNTSDSGQMFFHGVSFGFEIFH